MGVPGTSNQSENNAQAVEPVFVLSSKKADHEDLKSKFEIKSLNEEEEKILTFMMAIDVTRFILLTMNLILGVIYSHLLCKRGIIISRFMLIHSDERDFILCIRNHLLLEPALPHERSHEAKDERGDCRPVRGFLRMDWTLFCYSWHSQFPGFLFRILRHVVNEEQSSSSGMQVSFTFVDFRRCSLNVFLNFISTSQFH